MKPWRQSVGQGAELMPGNKVALWMWSDRLISRASWLFWRASQACLEQAIEYVMRLPLLILASKTGAAPTVVQILGDGADVETRAEDGSTALIMAALNGHAQVIETLLKKGAKVDATDQAGFTALIMAAGAGHADVVKQLLASGADVGARTKDGVTALMAAAFQGRAQVVETLLRHGAEVNATDRAKGTALMAAAGAGHADVVKQLLAAGSDRWLRRWNGETAATLASNRGHKNVLASLFDVESFSIELIHEKETEPGGKTRADTRMCWYVQATWHGSREILERPLAFSAKHSKLYRSATMQRRRGSQCWYAFHPRRRRQRNMMWRCSIWSVRSLSVRPWQNGIPRLRLSAKRSRLCMAGSPSASFFANVHNVQ